MATYDFSGWATRNDLLCNDGRTIRRNAFAAQDGQIVPMVWEHDRSSPDNVLGHALLENRDEGVYMYGTFNDTESGQQAKHLVQHGDIRSLSIYANKLKQHGGDVMHGVIREVSLVTAGANPGAYIESVMAHSDDGDVEELVICYDENITLYHSDSDQNGTTEKKENTDNGGKKEMADNTNTEEKRPTVEEVLKTFTEDQKTVMYMIVGQALADAGVTPDDNTAKHSEGAEDMKRNIFDGTEDNNVLTHADMQEIIADGKRMGSLKEAFLAHTADSDAGITRSPGTSTYGVDGIDMLFPDLKNYTNQPEFISRNMDWVQTVMNGVHHTPFSRVKSLFADITADEARAKGYIKGSLKKDEVFTLLKRETTATTVYKKQKIDRDDTIDITDFDVIAWIKGEMRIMLDEEIARAILIGDGRLSSSDDKISELNIRPIWKDHDLFAIKKSFEIAVSDDDDVIAKNFIKSVVKGRKGYKGSGTPTLFTTEDMVTRCLLLEDSVGRRIYNNISDLATAMRVGSIVTVEVMENQSRSVDGVDHTLQGIVVNLADYNVGADKGGAVNLFDDFDIDYNRMKYLIETRCSGALVKPFSAIVIESTGAEASEASDIED